MTFRFLACIALLVSIPAWADHHGEVKFWSSGDLKALPAELQRVVGKML